MSSIGVIVRTDEALAAFSPEWVPEVLGTPHELKALIESVGGIAMSNSARFDLRPTGLALELEIGDDDPPKSITASGVFGEAEVALLQQICRSLSANFFDSEEGRFVF